MKKITLINNSLNIHLKQEIFIQIITDTWRDLDLIQLEKTILKSILILKKKNILVMDLISDLSMIFLKEIKKIYLVI